MQALRFHKYEDLKISEMTLHFFLLIDKSGRWHHLLCTHEHDQDASNRMDMETLAPQQTYYPVLFHRSQHFLSLSANVPQYYA